jgi:hypothetical protein
LRCLGIFFKWSQIWWSRVLPNGPLLFASTSPFCCGAANRQSAAPHSHLVPTQVHCPFVKLASLSAPHLCSPHVRSSCPVAARCPLQRSCRAAKLAGRQLGGVHDPFQEGYLLAQQITFQDEERLSAGVSLDELQKLSNTYSWITR